MNYAIAKFDKHSILLVASVKDEIPNWGDDASIRIVKLINPKRRVVIKSQTRYIEKENYLVIGSIISWMTLKNSYIWGSGVVYPNQKLPAIPKKVYAVRGPLTRKYLIENGVECPEIYGDPALLFPRYYIPNVKKKYKLGVIPHFRDKQNAIVAALDKYSDILIIDVQKVQRWTHFIDNICRCENIVSSSLHGIIIADAYNVKNAWCEFEDGEQKRFAFWDYMKSVNKDCLSPYIINKDTNLEEMVKWCNKWQKPNIDFDKLYESCPFK